MKEFPCVSRLLTYMTIPCPASFVAGDGAFESVYGTLRNQARSYLRREQNACSMTPTVLVHEAWISLAKSRQLAVSDACHYVRLVSRVMKNLLIDRARRNRALTHGGGMQRTEWADTIASSESNWYDIEILSVAEALESLAAQSPQLAALVELRYFAGLTEAEAGQIMGVSSRSVRRYWNIARLRLMEILQAGMAGNCHVD